MGLYYKKDLPGGGKVTIWQITEKPAELISSLREQSPGFKGIPPSDKTDRQAEWLASRLLISLIGLDPNIHYDEDGKPHDSEGKYNLSLSHSGEFVAVISHPVKKVGIDIELTGERILRVKEKFAGINEKAFLKKNLEAEMLYVIWGAKECAFKIYGKGDIDFKNQLFVSPFDFTVKGKTDVVLRKGDSDTNYNVEWEYFGNLMLVFASE